MKWEFRKLFLQRRTIAAFGVFLAFELLLLAMIQHEDVRSELRRSMLRLGYTFDDNFTGSTIAALIMSNTIAVLGNLQIALMSGEIVAKEIEDGTMRTLLCRPVCRRRVFLSKLLMTLIFPFLVIGFISLTALPLGLLSHGTGYWLIPPMKETYVAHHEFWPGLLRYGCATIALSLSDWTLACLAFMFSCAKMKPVAAVVAAISILLVDDTLRELPFFASAKSYFVMTHVVGWLHAYDKVLPWKYFLENYALLFALNAAFVFVGWLMFRRRELKP